MGVPVPDDMDGRVLSEAFEDGYFRERPIRYAAAHPMERREQMELSPEEQEAVKERLRGLGYMA
jgi:hypothetical protein